MHELPLTQVPPQSPFSAEGMVFRTCSTHLPIEPAPVAGFLSGVRPIPDQRRRTPQLDLVIVPMRQLLGMVWNGKVWEHAYAKVEATSTLKILDAAEAAELRVHHREELHKNPAPFLHEMEPMMLGADPEIFLEADGKLLPAHEVLPKKIEGTRNPQEFWDGFQGEFTVLPRMCLQELTTNVREGLQHMLRTARRKSPTAKFSLASVVEIPAPLLASAPPEIVQLGCMPSLNVYGTKAEKVTNGRSLLYRFAGSHKHIGLEGNKPYPPAAIAEAIKCMDAFAGVASVSLAASFDNPIRRTYYGLAGEYRRPSYGIEWRTPSNFDLCHPAIHHLFWDLTRMAARFGLKGLRSAIPISDEEVQEAINNTDPVLARKLLVRTKDLIRTLYCTIWTQTVTTNQGLLVDMFDLGWKAIENGIESVVEDPTAIEKNWCLRHTDYQCTRSNCALFKKQWSDATKWMKEYQRLL